MIVFRHSQSFSVTPAKTGKIYIWPTRYGMLFSTLLVVMLLGSLNYKNNMGLMLTFLLAGICLMSLFRTHRSMTGIALTRITGDAPFAGDPLMVTLEGRCADPSSPEIAFTINASVGHGTLAPDGGQPLSLSLPTTVRGEVPLDRVRAETVYPLGLFRAWRTFVFEGARSVVYPAPIAGPLPIDGGGAPSGAGQTTSKKGSGDFDGHREYQPGDPPKHIDWRAYSRGQGLFSKIFAAPHASETFFSWDNLPAGDPEYRLSVMCHAVLKAYRERRRFGLRLPWALVAPDTGPRHVHTCLRHLALMGRKTAS